MNYSSVYIDKCKLLIRKGTYGKACDYKKKVQASYYDGFCRLLFGVGGAGMWGSVGGAGVCGSGHTRS